MIPAKQKWPGNSWAVFDGLDNYKNISYCLRMSLCQQRRKIAEIYNTRKNRQIKLSAVVFKKRLEKFVHSLPGKRVLDAGCGAGHDTGFLTGQGRDCLGIDLSKKMITYAKHHFRGKFRQGNLLELSCPRYHFHGIWCSAVLMHYPLADQRKMLKKFQSLLVTGGVLGLIFPGRRAVSFYNRPEDPRYAVIPSKLTAILKDEHFRIFFRERFNYTGQEWRFLLARLEFR